MLTLEEIKEIDEHIKGYPTKRAACIEALKLVQRNRRWISDDSLKDIADYLDMTIDELDGVATFYNLVFRKPVGRHVILICDSVSCWILGYPKLYEHLNRLLGISFGETTADDRFTLIPIPCLGTCDHAPALMIDNDLHRDLSPEKLDDILNNYK
ncbi:MAG TPA: NADH-quinone oxidoreductase subunit NuoE [Ignavibacteriaceae bacterium]|nr:NADH-quinone oxidoreductase subunit NuoE [Ignavibacteriaceae bacterium]